MLTNTVTLWLIFGILIVVWICFFVYEKLASYCRKPKESNAKVKEHEYKHVQGKFRHALFVGIPVRLLLLLFMIFAVTSAHNLLALGADFSSFVAILTLLILVGFIAYVTNKYFKFLRQDAQMKKTEFGWLARIMKLKRGQSRALAYPILYLGRRFAISLILVFAHELYAVQVIVWMLLSLLMMFTISRNKPFNGSWLNRVTFINEIFIFVGGVLMLPLANILEDLPSRDKIGIIIIVWIMICVAFNIIILLLRACYMLNDCCANQKKLEDLMKAKVAELIN
jgi:hypothetical protein